MNWLQYYTMRQEQAELLNETEMDNSQIIANLLAPTFNTFDPMDTLEITIHQEEHYRA